MNKNGVLIVMTKSLTLPCFRNGAMAGEGGVQRQTVNNAVSCQDSIGAKSYEEVRRNIDELRYLTRPKDGDRLSAKPSTVNDRRDVRVVWDLRTHTEQLHDWRGIDPSGKRVWVQIIGELICAGTGGPPPEWQSWSVDIDLDADSNNNGQIDPDPADPSNNTVAEDRIEADQPGTMVCSGGPLILRRIRPPLPPASTGTVFIRRSEADKIDIRRETVAGSGDFNQSIFPNPGAELSTDLFSTVRDNDLPLRMFALKKGGFNVDAILEAQVVFPKRTEYIKFTDRVRVRVEFPIDLAMDGVPDALEENPGGYVPVNADNDNGGPWLANTNNHIPTVRDFSTNPITQEDDLVGCTITAPRNLEGGLLRLRVENAGQARIRAWTTATKTAEITLPSDNPPRRFFVEGLREGAAEREVRLILEYVKRGAVLCTDIVVISVTPILRRLVVNDTPGAPDLERFEGTGWALVTEGVGQPGFFLEGEAIIDRLKSRPNSGLQFSQTLTLANNLDGGTVGARLNDGTTRQWNWLGAGSRQDSRNDAEVPFYISAHQARTGNSHVQQLVDRDSPALPIRSTRGDVLPPPGGATTVDVSFNYLTHLGFEFDDGAVYFIGLTDNWSVRFAGVIRRPFLGNPTFTPSANNGKTGSTGFSPSNANPTPVTTPIVNQVGANGAQWR